MEGDMAVDTKQLRIASLKGRLIHDVKIFGGLLGNLNAGGTFDVERRETGTQVWQITETHVHINGHAMIFKTISEHEDDVKTDFKPSARQCHGPAGRTGSAGAKEVIQEKAGEAPGGF